MKEKKYAIEKFIHKYMNENDELRQIEEHWKRGYITYSEMLRLFCDKLLEIHKKELQ